MRKNNMTADSSRTGVIGTFLTGGMTFVDMCAWLSANGYT